MDRRGFLKSLFAIGALTAVNVDSAIEQFLTETVKFSDSEFVTYVHYTMNMWVNNPSHCVIITDIGE